jgi:hypothetical protein
MDISIDVLHTLPMTTSVEQLEPLPFHTAMTDRYALIPSKRHLAITREPVLALVNCGHVVGQPEAPLPPLLYLLAEEMPGFLLSRYAIAICLTRHPITMDSAL